MALPAWYLEGEPLLDYGGVFYIEAFWALCSERQFGYAVGPIPLSAIEAYGRTQGFDRVMMLLFHYLIREMDDEYDRYNKREQGKRNRDREAQQKTDQK